jgi:hypothetical protein
MKFRRYTDEERRFLTKTIPGRSYAEIAKLFNGHFSAWYHDWNKEDELTAAQVNSFCCNNKISTGRTGRFQKGLVPHNKGKRGIQYEGSKATQFKKGGIPYNHLPVGIEVTTSDGYHKIKVAEPNVWIRTHIFVWEKANGPVPKGHAILFGDGDSSNTQLENLLLVSRAELAMLNKYGLIGGNADLTKTGVLTANLIMKITEKSKAKKSTNESNERLASNEKT